MTLNFKTFGQGEPLIILHGMFGTLDNWQTIAKQLADKYMVYIIDQRNHGRSPHDNTPFTYTTMREDLHAFMESNWLYKAHLIGHSMGGKVVMEFALHYPDMVDKLLVADIAPKAYAGGHEEVFKALFAVNLDTLTERDEALQILRANLGNDEGTVQFLMKNLSRKVEGGFEWKMNLEAIYKSYSTILGNIDLGGGATFDGDSLFVRGAKSRYVLDEDFPTITKSFPKATFQTIPNAGHWIHAEQPALFTQAVQAFLD